MGDEDIEAGVDDLDDTEDSAGATEMSPAVNTCPCNCLCCPNYEIPHQPTAAELEKSKSQSGRQTRSIQTSWYVKYPWIRVCTLGPSKPVGTLSIHGSVYALHPTISFAMFAVMQKK